MEWRAFGEGVIAGYGIAIPVGAIAILIVDTALRGGFVPGFMAGAGAASADLLYAALAAVAGQTLALALAPFAVTLRLLSALVLLALGGWGLWRLHRRTAGAAPDPVVAASAWRTYTQFLGLTLLNPLTVAYFGSLILGNGAGHLATTAGRVMFVLGAAVASLSWQSLLALIGAAAHRRLSPRFQLLTSLLGNLIVLLLGLRIAWQVLAA